MGAIREQYVDKTPPRPEPGMAEETQQAEGKRSRMKKKTGSLVASAQRRIPDDDEFQIAIRGDIGFLIHNGGPGTSLGENKISYEMFASASGTIGVGKSRAMPFGGMGGANGVLLKIVINTLNTLLTEWSDSSTGLQRECL